LIFQTILKLQ